MPPRPLPALRLALILTAAILFAILTDRPPAPLPANAPAAAFSADRAFLHLRHIAAERHPVGTAAHDLVRDYIVQQFQALGLHTEIQASTDLRSYSGYFIGVNVRNIIARLPGTANTKALLIATHYDSAFNGPGASDDGHAVAAALETARALRSAAPLRNDVVFLVTDGEELGLKGAHAFVEQNPAEASKVGAVLNFEARGTRGPAIMFETSDRNGWLIRRLAAAAPHLSATSLSYEIYRRMPNDTDLTVFKGAGMPGLNFAFIGSPFFYHTSRDTPANLQPGSLQQQGDYMLSLARSLGQADLGAVREPNRVYFALPGGLFVHYSETWAIPLALLGLAALAVVLARTKLRWKIVLAAVPAFVVALAAAAFAATELWKLIALVSPEYAPFSGGLVYNLGWHEGALLALALLAIFALVRLFQREHCERELAAGAFIVWALVAGAVTWIAPGASYFVEWPFLCAVAAFALGSGIAMELLAIPVLLIFVPTIRSFFIAMGMGMAGVELLLIVLFAGLLIPHAAQLLTGFGRRACFLLASLALAVCLCGGYVTRKYTPEHPKPNSVFFVQDADANTARWLSSDSALDPWTGQFFNGTPARRMISLPMLGVTRPLWNAPAPPQPLAPPEATVTERSGNLVRLHLRSPRGGTCISLSRDKADVEWIEINGRRAAIVSPHGFLLAMLAGIDKEADVAIQFREVPKEIVVSDMSYGLPIQVPPREPWMMAGLTGYLMNEDTVVSKTISLY